MKQARIHNLFSLIFNILILCAFLYVGVISNEYQLTSQMQYLEVSATIFYSIVAMICIVFNIVGMAKGQRLPGAMYVLRLMATATISLSLIFWFVVVGYQNGFDYGSMFASLSFKNPTLFLNLIIPALAIICFIFFDHTEEARFPINFLSMIPALIYGGAYIANYYGKIVAFNESYDFYGFNALLPNGVIIICASLILVALVMSILLYVLNRALSKAFYKEKEEAVSASQEETEYSSEEVETTQNDEVVEENEEQQNEQPVEEEEPVQEEAVSENVSEESEDEEVTEEEIEDNSEEEKPAKKPAAAKKSNKKPAAEKKPAKEPAPANNSGTKVYHLTKRKEDSMWAITFVGGKKPVKLFKTKKEAEEYLEVLTKNQGATALIRNSKGAKAGKFASSIKADDESKK